MINLQKAEFVRSAAKREDFPRDGKSEAKRS